jgi:hypothetical protein
VLGSGVPWDDPYAQAREKERVRGESEETRKHLARKRDEEMKRTAEYIDIKEQIDKTKGLIQRVQRNKPAPKDRGFHQALLKKHRTILADLQTKLQHVRAEAQKFGIELQVVPQPRRTYDRALPHDSPSDMRRRRKDATPATVLLRSNPDYARIQTEIQKKKAEIYALEKEQRGPLSPTRQRIKNRSQARLRGELRALHDQMRRFTAPRHRRPSAVPPSLASTIGGRSAPGTAPPPGRRGSVASTIQFVSPLVVPDSVAVKIQLIGDLVTPGGPKPAIPPPSIADDDRPPLLSVADEDRQPRRRKRARPSPPPIPMPSIPRPRPEPLQRIGEQFDFSAFSAQDDQPEEPDEKAPEPQQDHRAHENVAQPRVLQRIDRRAFGVPSAEEKKEEEEAFAAIRPLMRGRDIDRFRWNRFARRFTLESSHDNPRTYHRRPTVIHGSYTIPDSSYQEIVYVQPPPDSAYNNRFLNINPTAKFIRHSKRTDPIHGAKSHYWTRLGEFVQISAQPRAIHIRFLKRNIPDKAIRILVTRLIEHAQSNQVLNPRLFNVQKRGRKKILSMMLNTNQFLTETTDRITSIFRQGLKRSQHFILRQDTTGGILHDRISNDDLLM